MNSVSDWALRFIRWGAGLGVAGLVTGYFPLGHYLMKDSLPSCPAAPVHGHTILLGFAGMTLFGLVYLAMPRWIGDGPALVTLIRLHFRLAVAGTLGVCLNGTIGYEVLGFFQPHFYYLGAAGQSIRNVWFAIDGAFLTVYAAGGAIFLYVLMKHTAYSDDAQKVSIA
jgi:uncharacterized protein involved in response to NO